MRLSQAGFDIALAWRDRLQEDLHLIDAGARPEIGPADIAKIRLRLRSLQGLVRGQDGQEK